MSDRFYMRFFFVKRGVSVYCVTVTGLELESYTSVLVLPSTIVVEQKCCC